MKLTRASYYALQGLVHLARQPAGAIVPSHVIAEAQGVPAPILHKALVPLATARVLLSLKGSNGGYRLLRPAKQITLLEVVETVNGPIYGEAPAVADGHAGALDKKLQGICDGAAALVRERLAKVTLAELAKGK
jgi:Rrf2 family protein